MAFDRALVGRLLPPRQEQSLKVELVEDVAGARRVVTELAAELLHIDADGVLGAGGPPLPHIVEQGLAGNDRSHRRSLSQPLRDRRLGVAGQALHVLQGHFLGELVGS